MALAKLTEIPGWSVLHLFYLVDRARWHALPPHEREAAVAEMAGLIEKLGAEEQMQLVPQAGIAKADLAIMAVHPEAGRVQRLAQEIAATRLGTCLHRTYSFLSISEVSEYTTTAGDRARQLIDEQGMDPGSPEFAEEVRRYAERMRKYAEARVHPVLPRDLPVVCFYPMRKVRETGRNWYRLDFGERKRLMIGHGETGRRFAGRVLQLVTSCTGLDDWEWGVTLFARDLKSIRDVVYEMRYDEASALYAEFGPFYVGLRLRPAELGEVLCL